MKVFGRLLTAVAITVVATSCKKSSDPPDYDQGVGRCRLKAYTFAALGHGPYNNLVAYDEAGKILSVGGSGDEIHYDYSGNRIVIRYTDPANTLDFADTIFVDDAWRIKYMSYRAIGSKPGGHYWYYYAPDGHLISREDAPDGGSPHISDYYIWQNGDLVKDSIPGLYETIYNYDLSRTSQIADGLNNYLATAGSWPKSAHLYRGFKTHPLLSSSYTEEKISYGFDEQGKIIADTTSINHVVQTFAYECR